MGLVNDWVGMWMGHFLQRVIAGEGSTGSGGGTRVEDLTEVGRFVEVDSGGYLQEIESGGV